MHIFAVEGIILYFVINLVFKIQNNINKFYLIYLIQKLRIVIKNNRQYPINFYRQIVPEKQFKIAIRLEIISSFNISLTTKKKKLIRSFSGFNCTKGRKILCGTHNFDITFGFCGKCYLRI